MIDRMNIVLRLENWGLCQRGRGGGAMATRETRRTSRGGGGFTCMTDVVCNMMRIAATGPARGSVTQSRLDFEDAAVINRAWLQLPPRPKLLLRDHYALARPVNIICRELNIKHWPNIHWQRELLRAQEAINDIVNGGNR